MVIIQKYLYLLLAVSLDNLVSKYIHTNFYDLLFVSWRWSKNGSNHREDSFKNSKLGSSLQQIKSLTIRMKIDKMKITDSTTSFVATTATSRTAPTDSR